MHLHYLWLRLSKLPKFIPSLPSYPSLSMWPNILSVLFEEAKFFIHVIPRAYVVYPRCLWRLSKLPKDPKFRIPVIPDVNCLSIWPNSLSILSKETKFLIHVTRDMNSLTWCPKSLSMLSKQAKYYPRHPKGAYGLSTLSLAFIQVIQGPKIAYPRYPRCE